MSAGSLNQQPELQNVLNQCRRRIFLHTLIRGLATVLIVVVGTVLIATLFDYLLGLSAPVRMVSLVAAIGLTGWAAWRSLVRPLMQSLSPQQLGAAVDLSCPEFDESIATLLSLNAANVTSGEAGSAVMRGYLERQVAERLPSAHIDTVVDGAETQRRGGYAAALLALALIPLFFWPSGSRLLLQRMVSPLSNLATATNLYFEVPNPNRTVARGSTVIFAASPLWRTDSHGERPERVELQLIAEDGNRDSLNMVFDELAGGYVAEVARIANSVQYRIAGGGAETQLYSILVVDAPEIHGALMTTVPPDYTGQAVKQFDGMIGQMPVFEQSDVEIQLEFNKPVESAALVWIRRDARRITEVEEFDLKFDHMTGEEVVENLFGDWDPSRTPEEKIEELNPEEEDPDAPLDSEDEPLVTRVEGVLSGDGRSAIIHMTANVGGEFIFEVLDEHGLSNPPEPDRAITVVYDTPPELILRGVRADDRFRPDDILPVDAIAIDDIGIGALELHYRINEDVTRIVTADDFEHGSREVVHGFRLPLDDLAVKSGDAVTFRVKAADERPEPGVQVTWSNEITIHIDDDAEAAGAKALAEEVQAIVEALKRLEQEVAADKQKAKELKDKTPKAWDEDSRAEAGRLSEKEQQQGRILEKIADVVAQHPLMKDAAESLGQVSKELKDEIPENLDEASTSSRTEAKDRMTAAEQQLDGVREELNQQIANIEKIAELEQDLAELNRLALEAEQLAADADQLDQDRGDAENRPEELDQQEWDQELQDRQQELGEHQEELSDDLERLLQEERELLDAAQRAQREQMAKIGEAAKQLAEEQSRVSEGVQQEAKEAGQDAHEIAKNLEQSRQEAERLNNELEQKAPQLEPIDIDALKAAVEELRRGDLAEPQADVQQAAKSLRDMDERLQAAEPDNETMTPEQRQQSAEQADQLADQLAKIAEQIEQLRQERNATAPQENSGEAMELAAPSEEALPQAEDRNRTEPVEDLLKRLDELAEVADQMATDIEGNPAAEAVAQQNARQAADRVQQGSQDAQAGKFSPAAQEMRQAGDAAQSSSQQMNAAGQEDQKGQMAGLSDEFNRAAEALENLKLDDSSQATAQQLSQQGIAQQAAGLPEQLAELAERLNMETLQMSDEAQQAGQAQQAAQQAQQSSQQASSELQSGQLQQAAQSGQQTAEQLNQLSESMQPGGQQPGEEGGLVPSEVGESVAEALQDLAQAAQAMQQSSQPGSEGQPGESGESAEQAANGQPGEPANGEQAAQGEGQPGESGEPGQPGEGEPSGSQQLSSAAESLAQAARQALPNQFTPGQNAEGSESDAAGADSTGNAAMWNGLLPGQSGGPQQNRNWGQSNEELETETTSGQRVSRDSEYQALIRMYFREIARSGHPDR